MAFQSTLPVRGATALPPPSLLTMMISIHAPRTGSDRRPWPGPSPPGHFNPRSPYGERPERYYGVEAEKDFNPRSPYGERLGNQLLVLGNCHFNPRSPYGERRRRLNIRSNPIFISIHAPRTGSDLQNPGRNRYSHDFNPRSPYGERLVGGRGNDGSLRFQSTLPVRGATW